MNNFEVLKIYHYSQLPKYTPAVYQLTNARFLQNLLLLMLA